MLSWEYTYVNSIACVQSGCVHIGGGVYIESAWRVHRVGVYGLEQHGVCRVCVYIEEQHGVCTECVYKQEEHGMDRGQYLA